MAQGKRRPPIHPGQLLSDELTEIGTAMRLARYFGTSSQYWLHLQIAYDLEVADREIA